ncbi:hypothetical protein BASA50_004530 [Batrachochytrium salamandrivorans]|uniref:Uncharacterized protein n=1 Tax=Batrachochytrium salamandrivorans TaxID=1357716 RepID=A0ABQ8FG03_9FUNG|nr:hypothetical protein BASA50_004530 [Batrachochytrium salamandrivorans]
MKVATATIISFIVASASTYASPAAYSANQEVNTHGSMIGSSANAHLEKRGKGPYGDYAQGMRGAHGPPPNNRHQRSYATRGRQQHPQRPNPPRLHRLNQQRHRTLTRELDPHGIPQYTQQQQRQQHPTPPRELGPYEIPQHSQQHYQVNQDVSNPHEMSQNAQSAKGETNTEDEHDKSQDEDGDTEDEHDKSQDEDGDTEDEDNKTQEKDMLE